MKASQSQAQTFQAPGAKPIGLCDVRTPADLGLPTAPQPGGPPCGVIVATIQQACAEYVHRFERAYQLPFFFALAALALGALLPGWPLKWSGRRAPVPASAEMEPDTATISAAP